jgi:hypothetical protein
VTSIRVRLAGLGARLRGPALAFGWLVAAVLISLGAAGLVALANPAPAASPRPELTWPGDQAIAPALEAATDDLGTIAADVEQLGVQGRAALASLVATDLDGLTAAVDNGSALIDSIVEETRAVRRDLTAMPGIGPQAAIVLSPSTIDRHASIGRALESTDELPAAWARLTSGSIGAIRLTNLLVEHDRATASAALHGSAADYGAALDALDESDRLVAESRVLRDELANTVDVTTLDQWLDRNAAYDAALRELYTALGASDGRVTGPVRDAFAAEQAAREQLPPDTRGLTVILAEIARGGLNQAVIAVETARGELAAALPAGEGAPS